MKFIPYKAFKDANSDVNTIGLIIIHLDTPPQGANLDEMIERRDLRKKLFAQMPKDGAPSIDGFVLDKDEFDLIKDIVQRKWPWGTSDAAIEILRDIRDAVAPAADAPAAPSAADKAAE